MRRTVCLLLALAMLLSLCACGGAEKDGGTDGQDTGIAQGAPSDPQDGDALNGGGPEEDQPDEEDEVKLDKNGMRSLRGKSKEYKQNYEYVFEHQSEIVAMYYQSTQEELANSFKGTLNALRDAVAEVDPRAFDMIAADAAVNYGDNFLEMHLIYNGVNAYFSDSELGRGLRDISESLILAGVLNSLGYNDSVIRQDELELCAGNMDYALLKTRGTLQDMLAQMETDSGYASAVTALQWYYDGLMELHSQNVNEEIGIMWNGGGDQEAVQIKWDTLFGRMDACQDCIRNWQNERDSWMSALLDDLGLDYERSNPEDPMKSIYAIFDSSGKQLGVFAALDIQNAAFADDGSIVFSEEIEGGENRFRKIDRTGKDLVEMRGPLYDANRHFPMATTGCILRLSAKSDFDHGDYSVLEFVDAKGRAKELLEGRDFNAWPYWLEPCCDGYSSNVQYFYVGGRAESSDVFSVSYSPLEGWETTVYIDMSSGEVYEDPAYAEGGYERYVQKGVINDRYTLGRGSMLYANDNPDTPVADLSGGDGPDRVFWSPVNGNYWIISRSGYYYALDEDFNRVHEPVRIEGQYYDICPWGIILLGEDDTMALYGADGELLRSFPAVADVIGFMAGNYNLNTGAKLELEL